MGVSSSRDGSNQLARWREGWTELWKFLNTLGQRRDIDKQPLETAMREFIQAFEHTEHRIEQMLHGAQIRGECDTSEVDAVFDWIGLAYRLSIYALLAYWIDDKTEEKTIEIHINLTIGESSQETKTVKEMRIPKKYRPSARLGK